MTEDGKEIVFTINTRRFIALSIIAIITIISVGSYVIALLAFHSPSYDLRWNASISDINLTEYSPLAPASDSTVISSAVAPPENVNVSPAVQFPVCPSKKKL